MSRKIFILAAITGALLASSLFDGTAHAITFDPTHIIDDGVFYNKNAMSVQQIQSFLNNKVTTCDTWGTQPSEFGGGTRAQYGTAHGYPPPYVCLKNYYENPTTLQNNLNGTTPDGAISAAQIIYNAAQAYDINPEVLIVTLQKESSLVTDTWPFSSEYKTAMGYGCPDTGPNNSANCNSNYYGFYNQMTDAAWQFRQYAKTPNSFNFVPGPGNYVQYNPNTACGGTTLNIQNQATASLYDYTPYQPNAAALAAGYGTGDSCSAYGNRNFWLYFRDWFGTLYAQPMYASFYSQSGYPSLNPDQSAPVYFMYQNTGANTWYDDSSIGSAPAGTYPVHLATTHTLNRASAFGATWPNSSRAATTFSAVYEYDGTTLASNQHVVQPGQVVKFAFTMTAPGGLPAATYPEYFMPVAEGSSSGLFNDPGTSMNVTVNPIPSLTWQSQSDYPTIYPSQKARASISFTNNGSVALYDDIGLANAPSGTFPVHLATSNPLNRASDFSADWTNSSRPAVNFASVYMADGTTLAPNQHVAQPGQIVKFTFNFTVPLQYANGNYKEYFQPVLEGSASGTFADQGVNLVITVPSSAVISYTQIPSNVSVASNQPSNLVYSLTNVGNATLPGTDHLYTANGSAFKAASWTSNNIIGTVGSDVAAGQSTVLTVPTTAPLVDRHSIKDFDLSLVAPDATDALPGSAITTSISIATPTYRSSFAGQSTYPTMTYGQVGSAYMSFKNIGNQPWYDDTSIGSATWPNAFPIHMATSHIINRSSGFASGWPNPARTAYTFSAVYESDGTTPAANQHIAQPGQIVKFIFDLSPANWVPAGSYDEYFQLVAEGTPDGAFNDLGAFLRVKVTPQNYLSSFYSQSTYPTIAKGSSTTAYFMFKNTGNTIWYDDTAIGAAPQGNHPVHLATANPINRVSDFSSTWPNSSRAALNLAAVYESDGTSLATDQHVVKPDQIAKFTFNLSVPSGYTSGKYTEYFQLVAEGTKTGAFNYLGAAQVITVP